MVREATRRTAIAVVLALFGASALILWLGEIRASTAAPLAESAKRKNLTVVNTVRLHLVRKNGNVLVERGTATGTFPGRVSARFRTSLTKVTGRVTFRPYSGGGSITMTAIGYPSSTGRITGLSGSMAVRRGTGKYRNALGSGTFTGTANRRTWAVTVNARANLTY